MLQNKSGFSFHRTTSINSELGSLLEEDMFKSITSVAAPKALRRHLRILKEKNTQAQTEVETILGRLRKVREESSRYIREGLVHLGVTEKAIRTAT